MSQPTNLHDSYPGTGMREDISDLIHNISPTETPFLSAIGTTSATQRTHQWQTDTLKPPNGANAAVEGQEAALESQNDTVMNANHTQISTKTFGVSGSMEVFEKYGRDSEMAYKAALASRELKTDVDMAMTGVKQDPVIGDSGTARQAASLEVWLATNRDFEASGSAPTFAAPFPAGGNDGLPRAFAQSQLDNVITRAWKNGGKPSIILAGPVQKTKLSGFDGVGSISGASETIARSDAAGRTIYATADVYVSNFGELKVVPTRHIRVLLGTGGTEGSAGETGTDRNVFVVDPEYAKTGYARPWQQYDLAKTGDSIRRQMLVEWTLEVCNEKAHGQIADLGGSL